MAKHFDKHVSMYRMDCLQRKLLKQKARVSDQAKEIKNLELENCRLNEKVKSFENRATHNKRSELQNCFLETEAEKDRFNKPGKNFLAIIETNNNNTLLTVSRRNFVNGYKDQKSKCKKSFGIQHKAVVLKIQNVPVEDIKTIITEKTKDINFVLNDKTKIRTQNKTSPRKRKQTNNDINFIYSKISR